MRKVINRAMLTLASVGLLTAGGAASLKGLHETVRGRVLGSMGHTTAGTPTSVRAALRKDPDFDELLESHTRRVLATVRRHPEAEDAVQETMLKVWRGRPDLFLKTHDDVVRYLSVAAKRNLATCIQKTTGRGRSITNGNEELIDVTRSPDAGPDAVAGSDDLIATLVSRLEPGDSDVLDAYLEGHKSQRSVAVALGISRHAVNQATERIGTELLNLTS